MEEVSGPKTRPVSGIFFTFLVPIGPILLLSSPKCVYTCSEGPLNSLAKQGHARLVRDASQPRPLALIPHPGGIGGYDSAWIARCSDCLRNYFRGLVLPVQVLKTWKASLGTYLLECFLGTIRMSVCRDPKKHMLFLLGFFLSEFMVRCVNIPPCHKPNCSLHVTVRPTCFHSEGFLKPQSPIL